MTSTIDPSNIGKPLQRTRRHVRTLTGKIVSYLGEPLDDIDPSSLGYTPETDETGKEKWPKGDEKVWKESMRGLDTGELSTPGPCSHVFAQMQCHARFMPIMSLSYPRSHSLLCKYEPAIMLTVDILP